MTTTMAPISSTVVGGTGLRVTQSRVLLSEWTKLRSLRSTLATLLVAFVLLIGLGAMFAAITASGSDPASGSSAYGSDPASGSSAYGSDPASGSSAGQPGGFAPGTTAISTSLTGTFFAQLAVGVLGVLLISGEYSTGMIRSSLTVVPRRLPMLWAKSAVFAGTVFLTMLVASVISFLVSQALLGDQLNASLSDSGAVRAVVGAALYLTVAGLTAIALGALLRNTAAAITTFVAVFFVIPPLTNLLPMSLTDRFVQYLPSNAGAMLLDGTYGIARPLSPWTGFAVMCAYAVVLIGLAAWRLRNADA